MVGTRGQLRTGARLLAPLAITLLACCIAVPAASADITALRVEIPGAPKRMHGSDGREHINYDVVITNGFVVDVMLTSVTVSGGGRRLLRLAGAELARFTHMTIGAGDPTTTIPASSTVATLIDVALPRSAGRRVPKRLTTRVSYTVPSDAPFRAVIDSLTVRRTSRVDRRRPIVIASPVRGAGWMTANGCCADPTSPHRNLILANDGRYVTPEMFAIDYVSVVDGKFFSGDGMQNSDFFPEAPRSMPPPRAGSSRRSTTAQRCRPGCRPPATRR